MNTGLRIMLIAVMVFLACCARSEMDKAEWVLYSESANDAKLYYDKHSLVRSGDMVRMWSRAVHSTASAKAFLDFFREQGLPDEADKLAGLAESRDLLEMNCVTKQHRVITRIFYDSKGKPLASYEYDLSEWSAVTPDSVGEAQYEAVCPRKEAK